MRRSSCTWVGATAAAICIFVWGGCSETPLSSSPLKSALSRRALVVEDISDTVVVPAPTRKHPGLGSHVLGFMEARRVSQGDALSSWARRHGLLLLADGRLQVEAPLRPGAAAEDLSEAALERAGASLLTRGVTIVDLAVPAENVRALEAVLDAAPMLAGLQAPLIPTPEVGAAETQGVAKTLADAFHTMGIKGAGVEVAVMDIGWEKWSDSKTSNDLPSVSANPSSQTGGTHGTNCAQVVADMAPDAVLRPVDASTLAKEESFINNTLSSTSVNVITRSLSGTMGYFSDGKGPYCDNATVARQKGVVMINSAGNYADGRFWLGTFKDADGDGWHEWSGTDEMQTLTVTTHSRIKINLDWDDYPTSSQDFDLFLSIKKADGSWDRVDTSEGTQSGSQAPREWVSLDNPTAGTYGLSVKRKSGSGSMTLRIFAYSGPKLEYSHAKGSLNPPATCADVLSVAAIPYSKYTTGPQIDYSSQGPTWDGRTDKPDVAAPTLVNTSLKSAFSGTSAAAPHVAGAIALYMDAMNGTAIAARAAIIADATPMGTGSPNTIYGHGRVELDVKRAGCACAPGDKQSCSASCGASGTRSCLSSCSWSSCVPPAESCNGQDDDCDGTPDNGFDCVRGASETCVTKCNTAGERRCSASCSWQSCVPPQEICNNKDDDCDGLTDEDGVCGPGADAGVVADSGGGLPDGPTPWPDSGGGQQLTGTKLVGGCALGGHGKHRAPWVSLLVLGVLVALRRRRRL